MKNIIIKLKTHDSYWNKKMESLKKYANITVLYNKSIETLCNANIIISTRLSEAELDCCPNLEVVFTPKTGIDKLPIDVLKKRNIKLVNSHINSRIIAERTLTLLLSLMGRVIEYDAALRQGIWKNTRESFFWESLFHKRIGIVGLGKIGLEFIKLISPFDCSISAINNSSTHDGVTFFNNIHDLAENNDIIILFLPLTEKTKGIINSSILNQMQKKYLINIGRAETVDEESLFYSLNNRLLKGAAFDVWYSYPDKELINRICKPSNCQFEKFSNIVMSAHCATHTIDAKHNYIDDITKKTIKYLIYNTFDSFVDYTKGY
jgi:phosphoglycerate dehydrogenase-like enzyme